MESSLLLATFIGVFLAVATIVGNAENIKTLPNLHCYPRPSVVQTKSMFYPYFVSLHRCNGSKGTFPPSRFKCVPKKTEDKHVFVYNQYSHRFLTLKNHTECETQCAISREECKYPNIYDPSRCTCTCHHSAPPADLGSCGPKRIWSSTKCGCQCIQRVNCPKRYIFDEESCACKCKPERKRLCESMNGIFKPETCGCRKAQRQTSPDDDSSDSFVGSTAFWVYILIGEFVLLLVCFDVILYCKKMGVIYRITQSCRRTTVNVKEEEGEVVDEPLSLKAHYNDVCDSAFSSLHDISRPNAPSAKSKLEEL